VRILQDGIDGPTGDVDIAREVLIEITYWNLVEGTPLYSALWLKSQMGTFVLSSSNARSQALTPDEWHGRPAPKGLFRSVCRIPANFLNEGRYDVTPLVGRPPTGAGVFPEAVIGFDVHDTGAMREEYTGSWAGPVVRPRLAWSTRRLE
jgi:lipopolysaccharide transport system ATP-binding protein